MDRAAQQWDTPGMQPVQMDGSQQQMGQGMGQMGHPGMGPGMGQQGMGGPGMGQQMGGMPQRPMVASGMNLAPLKEPRGFIRCIEWILAIFAFATTTSHSSSSSFSVDCKDGPNSLEKTIDFAYPYRLYTIPGFQVPICNTTKPGDYNSEATIYGNFASAAEFYVFVGVMAFLYSMASLAIYIFFDERYRKFDQIPCVDFIVTGVFSVLFLIATSAWAQNVTHIKYYTNPEELFVSKIPDCKQKTADCTVDSYANFASLNVSLIFGFLNMAVWGANLWFLFKETKWFKVQQPAPPAGAPGMPVTEQQPQRV